jgi:hypothetical protein
VEKLLGYLVGKRIAHFLTLNATSFLGKNKKSKAIPVTGLAGL